MKGAVVFILLALGVAFAAPRPDLNAFLNHKASNLSELIRQVKKDPAVMDRYCRHYQMSPSQVIEHLKTLKPGVITKHELYTVYSVPQGGYLKSHVEFLKLGTKVYYGADGKPELVAKCGNPLRGPKPDVDLEVELLDNPSEKTRDIEPDPVFMAEMIPPSVEPPGIIVVEEPPVEEMTAVGTSAIPLVIPSATALLFPVGLFVATVDGGSTPGVPGPAAAIPFLIGIATVARARRRARRS